jgi:hypothetical protein
MQQQHKTTKKQYDKTEDKYVFKNIVKIAQKQVQHKVYTYYTRSTQQTVGKNKNLCTYYE